MLFIIKLAFRSTKKSDKNPIRELPFITVVSFLHLFDLKQFGTAQTTSQNFILGASAVCSLWSFSSLGRFWSRCVTSGRTLNCPQLINCAWKAASIIETSTQLDEKCLGFHFCSRKEINNLSILQYTWAFIFSLPSGLCYMKINKIHI